MKISVNPKVFKVLPKLTLAFILVKGMDNKIKLKKSLPLLQEAETLVRLTFNKDTIKTHHLLSPWAVARQEFGKKAKHYHTSVERLLHLVLARKSIASNNVLTNIVRYLAVKYILPIEVDDAHKINGTITFTVATGKEKNKLLQPGDVYYHNQSTILGTKLDYWKNKTTALRPGTKSALIHIEIIPPLTIEKLKEIAIELEQLVALFCGGKVTLAILDRNHLRAVL